MALIKCPECGKEVSDKAIECPQCKTKLKETEPAKKICLECGEELQDDEQVCPKCGCPVPTEAELKTEVYKKKKKQQIIYSVCAIFVLILLIFGINMYQTIQKENAEKAAQEQAIKEAKEYSDNLMSIVAVMVAGGSEAETAGNLIHDVWYDTIYDEYDPETSKYVSGHSDFNDSLQALFDDTAFSAKIEVINGNREIVAEKMKEMTNPPESKEAAYNELKGLYDSYLELTNIVVNPTGTLKSFTEAFNEADTTFAKKYESMRLYIE